jgi:shikimate kinase
MKVVVLGPMGAGKSTVGQLVSERLGAKMVDSDRVIESEYGRSGRQIAASDGVLALHDIEARVLSDALDAEGDAVIAPAASAVERPELRERLKRDCLTFHLDLPAGAFRSRTDPDDHRRAVDDVELAEMSARRTPLFASVATATLDASLPASELASRIIDRCRAESGRP